MHKVKCTVKEANASSGKNFYQALYLALLQPRTGASLFHSWEAAQVAVCHFAQVNRDYDSSQGCGPMLLTVSRQFPLFAYKQGCEETDLENQMWSAPF